MSTPAGEAKRARREEARAKAAQLQKQAEAAERRRRALWVGLVALVVAALAIGITLAVRSSNEQQAASAPQFGDQGVVAIPAPAGSKAAAANAVTVRTAFDYMCPACKSFEEATDAWLQQQVKAGTIKREFVPVAILDRFSQGTQFSTRSSSAAYCVATADRSKIYDFTKAMFAAQPAEGSTGLTNEQMLAFAKNSVPNNPTMDKCITDAANKSYAGKITDQASKDGLQGTPTVWVNGKQIEFVNGSSTLDQLKKAVADARK